ncbi:hypothetical protein BN1723_010853 [Verticillium longisporum]|uniref:Azaphilone pigments biosynthesis cluster protein L N-terminal domain-containing protein n=1 Tax=Verticillium longisporum TaxID=100787 RepID=A0A0G4LJH2_VERLO|nr:hypothetical protein BN1723_010853 [Verticillium longisporum]CRK22168.1 hypothetical protein BN1708_013328 [Verticillium longisporum]
MLALLEGPFDRCGQLCHEFQVAMEDFNGKSNIGFRDWTKMEFMKGDINEFMDTLSGYKSTISVGPGTLTLQMSKASHDVLERYSEMVQNTSHDLKIHLQRIDEKMALFTSEIPNTSDIDLKDERAVTAHCIRICEDAQSYLDSLVERERQAQVQTPPPDPAATELPYFEVRRETHKVLGENRDSIAKHIGRLHVFDVKKALSKGMSAQLIGSMTDESLRQMSQDRYRSRFGSSARTENDVSTSDTIVDNSGTHGHLSHQVALDSRRRKPDVRARAGPNEMRKRTMEGE